MGFRIGIIRGWQAKWYSNKHYVEFLHEDLKLRQAIQSKYTEAGISLVETERQASKVSVTIYTSRPGVVIGRGGQRVDEMRHCLEGLIGKPVQLNIQEIQQPELDAFLVARTIAEQIGHRISYRRVMKQAIFRTIQAGAKGVNEVVEPAAGEVVEPAAGEVVEPAAGEVVEPAAGEVVEPVASEVVEPVASEVVEAEPSTTEEEGEKDAAT
jgi:small subunit ribosomal protein S3